MRGVCVQSILLPYVYDELSVIAHEESAIYIATLLKTDRSRF